MRDVREITVWCEWGSRGSFARHSSVVDLPNFLQILLHKTDLVTQKTSRKKGPQQNALSILWGSSDPLSDRSLGEKVPCHRHLHSDTGHSWGSSATVSLQLGSSHQVPGVAAVVQWVKPPSATQAPPIPVLI